MSVRAPVPTASTYRPTKLVATKPVAARVGALRPVAPVAVAPATLTPPLSPDNSRELSALASSLLGAAKPSSVLWVAKPISARRVDLFGFQIENVQLQAAARDLALAAKAGLRTRVVFANAHVVNSAKVDAAYHATVASADRVYADGSGMAIAARICGRPLRENVNGTDLFPVLCQDALVLRTRIFLLGGKPGVAARAQANLSAFGLGDAIAGTHHGYFAHGSAQEDEVIAAINASGAQIVLVGFGVPLQDQWVERNAHRLNAPVIAGVGGLFDFFAGEVSRSPKLMRSLGCEWMWRLALEPRRMARRYLIGNIVFLIHALREALLMRRRLQAPIASPSALPR